MTPALIRCAGKTPAQAIDIMVQSDGGITSLGQGLSSLCRNILWGEYSLPFLSTDPDPEMKIRYGREENLGAMVFGLLWPAFDKVETCTIMDQKFSRRYSHNQFVIGPADDTNLKRAYYVYHLEFRDYPGLCFGSKGNRRVWIAITNDRLETIFEGWPENVLEVAENQIAARELSESNP